MIKNLHRYISRAMAMPITDLVPLVARMANQKISRPVRRWRDEQRMTYVAPERVPSGNLFRYFSALSPERLRSGAKTVRILSDNILSHRFDLLGSGPTDVRNPHEADKEGRWLEGRISPLNLETAQRIWRLVDDGYHPIDWHLDFKSAYRWNETTWYEDIPLGHVPGVDIKVPWELARMQHLAQLVWGAVLAMDNAEGFTNAERYIREIRNQILDFIATNPPRFGVNWRCPMDVAIRAANWLAAIDLAKAEGFRFDDEFEACLRQSIYEHGRHLVSHLEWFPDRRGNHYLANITGLIFIASYLPRTPETDAWLALGVQEMIGEIGGQFHPDGGNIEGSTAYHRLSAEMAVYGTALILGLGPEKRAALSGYDHSEINTMPPLLPAPIPMHPLPGCAGSSPFQDWHFEHLERTAHFVVDATKPSGRMVQIGDNDSGRFFKFQPHTATIKASAAKARFRNLSDWVPRKGEEDYLFEDSLCARHLTAAANGVLAREALATFAGPGHFEDEIVRALAKVCVVAPEIPPKSALHKNDALKDVIKSIALDAHEAKGALEIPFAGNPKDIEAIAYPDFGLFILRGENLWLSVRCGGEKGDSSGAHRHNDQLGVEIVVGDRELSRDPGCGLYTPAPNVRNAYRSINAHFAPQTTDLREPSPLEHGLFWLGAGVEGECLHFSKAGFAGKHAGYGPSVWRSVEIKKGKIIIRDFAEEGLSLISPKDQWADEGYAPSVSEFSPGYGIFE
jgi:hypothetical protein